MRQTDKAWIDSRRKVWAEQEASNARCAHTSYTQDKATGECHCDQCGKLLIDSMGRVLE